MSGDSAGGRQEEQPLPVLLTVLGSAPLCLALVSEHRYQDALVPCSFLPVSLSRGCSWFLLTFPGHSNVSKFGIFVSGDTLSLLGVART